MWSPHNNIKSHKQTHSPFHKNMAKSAVIRWGRLRPDILHVHSTDLGDTSPTLLPPGAAEITAFKTQGERAATQVGLSSNFDIAFLLPLASFFQFFLVCFISFLLSLFCYPNKKSDPPPPPTPQAGQINEMRYPEPETLTSRSEGVATRVEEVQAANDAKIAEIKVEGGGIAKASLRFEFSIFLWYYRYFTVLFRTEVKLKVWSSGEELRSCTLEWWDSVLQKRLTWALFVLFSTLVCCQPTELNWAFIS